MASDAPVKIKDNAETTIVDGESNHKNIEHEALGGDAKPKSGGGESPHTNLTIEARESGNDEIKDKVLEENSEIHTGLKSKFDKDECGQQCKTAKSTENQINCEPPKKNNIIVECGEISTTVKSECSEEVSKPESKRHNVFKSIIDRLARKEVGRMESQTNHLPFPVGGSKCLGSTASAPNQHFLSGTQNPAAVPHSSTSPGILFTSSSSSSSACSGSSSALNLSFLFRGFPGYEDSGTSLSSEQGISEYLPSKVPYPISKLQGSLANWKVPAGKRNHPEKVGLHSEDDQFLDGGEIFRDKAGMLELMMPADPTGSHPDMSRDLPVVCLDLEDEEAAASQVTCRLGTIKRKYYKSLDYLRKVHVISCTLEKEREKLRLKRLCLQRALHKLRFLYNVTRLRCAKGRTLDRQTISSLWNLAKFEDAAKEKHDDEEEDGGQEDGRGWHNSIEKRLETGSDQGSSPRSSPAGISNKQAIGDKECDDAMQVDCDDDVTTTSLPLNYSLRENDEKSRGSQCNGGIPPVPLRSAHPFETEPLINQCSRRCHPQAAVDGTTAWRHINSPLCSAKDQQEELVSDDVTKTNNVPAHSTGYSRSNRLDSRKRMGDGEGVGGRGVGGGYAAVNYHRAHITSNRLDVNVGRTPSAAHEMKRDLNNFTYLYCSQNSI